jgi:hypothetical protein
MAGRTRFFGSVLPADPVQLTLLLGMVCRLVSVHPRWKMGTGASLEGRYGMPRALLYLSVLPVLFAGFFGYYFCFWKVKQPVRKIVLLVVPQSGAWFVQFTSFIAQRCRQFQ